MGQGVRLRELSVGAITAGHYSRAVAEFEAWVRSLGVDVAPGNAADAWLERFLDLLASHGEHAWVGRNLVFGYIWRYALPPGSPLTLPAAKQALRGWLRVAPGGSRDPIPWLVVAGMAHWLVNTASSEALLAATAFVVSADMYLRPTECLRIARQHIFAPVKRSRYADWSIVIFPFDEGIPSKTYTYDHTVTAGTPAAGRGFVRDVIEVLFRTTAAGRVFAGLELQRYEFWVREASRAVGVQSLRPSPHGARHCGPSEDAYLAVRSLDEIKHRGRWAAPQSVERYSKFGALLRQLNKLSVVQRRDFERQNRELPALLLRALRARSRASKAP